MSRSWPRPGNNSSPPAGNVGPQQASGSSQGQRNDRCSVAQKFIGMDIDSFSTNEGGSFTRGNSVRLAEEQEEGTAESAREELEQQAREETAQPAREGSARPAKACKRRGSLDHRDNSFDSASDLKDRPGRFTSRRSPGSSGQDSGENRRPRAARSTAHARCTRRRRCSSTRRPATCPSAASAP